MKRAMVIGCCGAGKSVFSQKLHSISKLELIHLDQYYWKPGWKETDPTEWQQTVEVLAAKPKWIIDGNYGGTMEIRIQRADTIIYLDYPTWECLWRITKRVLKYWGRERPDMPNGCKERFDLGFFHYVATYNWRRRKKLLQKLNSLKDEKRIMVFKNDKASEAFLKSYKKNIADT